MGLVTTLFEKGKLNPKQLVKILKKFDERIAELEKESTVTTEPSEEETPAESG